MSWWSSNRSARREPADPAPADRPARPGPDLFEVAFDHSPTGIAVLSEDATVLDANASLGALLGRPAGDLVGTRFADLLEPGTRPHPDDGTDLAALLHADARADESPSRRPARLPVTGTASRREVCLHSAGGHPVWAMLRWSAAAAGPDGRHRLVVDVSDLPADLRTQDAVHELDTHMENVADASQLGIVLLNLEGRVLYVNPEMCELLGYSADELRASGFGPLIHPEERDKTSAQLRKMVEQGAERHQTIRRYVRKDGRILYCRRVVYVCRGLDGAARTLLVFLEPRGTA